MAAHDTRHTARVRLVRLGRKARYPRLGVHGLVLLRYPRRLAPVGLNDVQRPKPPGVEEGKRVRIKEGIRRRGRTAIAGCLILAVSARHARDRGDEDSVHVPLDRPAVAQEGPGRQGSPADPSVDAVAGRERPRHRARHSAVPDVGPHEHDVGQRWRDRRRQRRFRHGGRSAEAHPDDRRRAVDHRAVGWGRGRVVGQREDRLRRPSRAQDPREGPRPHRRVLRAGLEPRLAVRRRDPGLHIARRNGDAASGQGASPSDGPALLCGAARADRPDGLERRGAHVDRPPLQGGRAARAVPEDPARAGRREGRRGRRLEGEVARRVQDPRAAE